MVKRTQRRKATRPATKKAIEKINRRADTLARVYGKHSEEYELFTTEMANLLNKADDIYTTKDGLIHIRNTANARENFRQINAFAKRATKTPVSVLKREKEKRDSDFFDEHINEQPDDKIIDYDTYNSWSRQFETYFDSCYALAALENAAYVYERADELYNNSTEYTNVWNDFYRKGEFDEYKVKEKQYNAEETQQEYEMSENGVLTEKDAFYRDLSQRGIDIDYGF